MNSIHRLGSFLVIVTSLALLLGVGCGNDARHSGATSSASGNATPAAASSPSAEDPENLADVSACSGVTLTPSLMSPQTTGPSVVFAATASCGAKTPEYAFHLDTREGGFVLQQGYSTANTWTWPTSGLLPGHYAVRVKVRVPGKSGVQAHTSVDYHLDCVPKTCADQGAECGFSPDECGGMLNCGNCPTGSGTECAPGPPPLLGGTCEGCDYSYYPYTCFDCSSYGLDCGWAGGQYCGRCKAPETCGGGGVANQCGSGFTGCLPYTSEDLGVQCGSWPDGCGGTINIDVSCGCGTDGTPGACGTSPKACVPITCEEYGFDCGYVGDGCVSGGVVNCGVGKAARCKDRDKACVDFKCKEADAGTDAGGSCTPYTCAFYGAECGNAWYDGCGGILDCGACPPYTLCGGDGTPGVCGVGTPCVPLTCAFFGFDCGSAVDGCGGTLECGACEAPKTCGGGSPGRGNRCGE